MPLSIRRGGVRAYRGGTGGVYPGGLARGTSAAPDRGEPGVSDVEELEGEGFARGH